MNLASSAIVIAAVALPGFLFWRVYHKRDLADRLYNRLSSERSVKALLTSIPLNALGVWCAEYIAPYFGCVVRLDVAFALVAGKYGNKRLTFEKVTDSLTECPEYVVLYFLGLYLLSAMLGGLLLVVATSTGWDRKFKFLRFNDWYYLLQQDLLDNTPRGTKVQFVLVAALVETATKNYIYRGICRDYWVDASGGLLRLELTNAERREIGPPDEEFAALAAGSDDEFYPIVGDSFLVDVATVKNLNLKYTYLRRQGHDPQLRLPFSGVSR